MVKEIDLPWRVVEVIEGLPEGTEPVGFFNLCDRIVVIAGDGFFAKDAGVVQKLQTKIIDKS